MCGSFGLPGGGHFSQAFLSLACRSTLAPAPSSEERILRASVSLFSCFKILFSRLLNV